MEWGTKAIVASEGAAESLVAQAKARLPEVPSAYVPSGALPPEAVITLALGAGAGALAGAAATLTAGAITLALLGLLGALIAVIAFCGAVACITVIWELGIALVGGAITFAAAGVVGAWVTTWVGKLGKNRNATFAALASLGSALGAVAIAAAVPPALAYFWPPTLWAGGDFAPATLVHLVGDYGWPHLVVLAIGALVAAVSAWFVALEMVSDQKFCEGCKEYMDAAHLWGANVETAEAFFAALRSGDGKTAAAALARETGLDVETELWSCKRCGAGFVESRGHVRAAWPDGKGGMADLHRDWRCFSVATTGMQATALAACKRPETT